MTKRIPVACLPYFVGQLGKLREIRFWSKVDMRGPDECWDWQGSCTDGGDGYGRFKVTPYQTLHANRVAWALTNRTDPGALIIRHKCDRPQCCNPAHLEPGTVADNNRDARERGRHRTCRQDGEHNGAAKLTEAQIAEIVAGFRSGLNNKQIAARLPVGHALISRIRTGRSWQAQAKAAGWTPRTTLPRLSSGRW